MVYKFFLGFWLTVVILVAFIFPIVPQPRHWYEFPIIPGLEEKARILFFHVPMSWTAVVAFVVSMVYAIKYLAKKQLDDDLASSSSAGLGLMFSILATITGSVWAKFNWGSFWNWDPRETSIFVLLLIYGAYFALRSAVDSEDKRAVLSAVYAIIAGVTVPFFIFIMPRIVASLHPEPIVNAEGKVHMNGIMLTVFVSSLVGFTALYFWMLSLRVRTARLELHRQQD
ncbi:MAG: cytochrome c biogenesis protein CcsA [Ignavibacteriae bacterium]|nr:cytochrome c biogenesis protein CcsA [Ignavibacteriota bacterium]